MPKPTLNLPSRYKKSNWSKKVKKSQMSFGLFSKIRKAKGVEKKPKITHLAKNAQLATLVECN